MEDREYVFQVFEETAEDSGETPYVNFYAEFEDALDYPIYLHDPRETVWWFGGGPQTGTRKKPSETLESYLEEVAAFPPLTRYIYNLSPSDESTDESISPSDFEIEELPAHEEKFFLDLMSQLGEDHIPAEMCFYLQELYERDNQPPDGVDQSD